MTGILKRPSALVQPTAEGPFWPDTKQRINDGLVTPLLSEQVAASLFGVEREQLALEWARLIESPLPEHDNHSLARVAQYYSIYLKDPYKAKRHYIDTLKLYLLGMLENDQDVDQDEVSEYMDAAVRDSQDLAQIATKFGYPRVADPSKNPLRLLAELPLPVYLTTSRHKFLEAAIASTGAREAVSEIFYWHDGLKGIDSIFQTEPDYDPRKNNCQRPLVYHLFGLDVYPESIVLTEDDHLDCLIKLSTLMHEVKHPGKTLDMPACVYMALSAATLLLLGYDVYQWDCHVIFKGLIQPTADSRKKRLPSGRAMQLKPKADKGQQEKIEVYLRQFFGEADFEIYWGDLAQCIHSLWTVWKGNAPA